MAADRKHAYWDACVFIHAFQKTAAHYSTIIELEKLAKAGEWYIFGSTLIIAEVVKPNHAITDSQARSISNYFRNNRYIKIVPVDRKIAQNAAEIVRNHGLKPADAIHIATAIRTKCEVFYTYDGDGNSQGLLQKDGKIGVPALPIKRPGEWGQMTIGMNPS